MGRTVIIKFAVLVLAFVFQAGTSIAGDLSPVGHWQSANGDSRYEVTYCGDGTRLCARLTWLRSDLRTDENLQYVNKLVVRGARRTASNKWFGTIDYAGDKIGGSVVLLNMDTMRFTGCKLLVCQTLDFKRV